MQKTVSIKDIFSNPSYYLGQQVTVAGWGRTIRDQKQFCFVDLADGSCLPMLQVVATTDLSNYSELVKAGNGAALIVTGKIVNAPQGSRPVEMQAHTVEVEGISPSDYPLQPKRHTVEYLRTIAHLRPRTNLFNAAFRVRSEAAFAIHDFFHKRNFVYVHTPLITGSDCEGAGEMFTVTTLDQKHIPFNDQGEVDYAQDFFGKHTHLTVSGQLNGEVFAQAFKNIYTFGPTFRAENSYTPRHAAEFWMIEPELAFADLNDMMGVAKDMLQHIITHILKNCPNEIEFFNKFIDKGIKDRLEHVATADFAHVTYTDAIELLKQAKQNFKYPVYWGVDLQTEHERYLTEQLFKKPVFVTDYPKEIKAFYMRLNDDNKTVAAVDCLVPGIGEIIGGSQREERLDYLIKRLAENNLPQEEYWWYLELRKYGSTRHAGYGLGFERLIMYLTGISNIRDVLPFPRTTGSAEF